MQQVFKAHNKRGEPVALKLLDLKVESSEVKDALQHEFKMAKRMLADTMQHPNLLNTLALFGNDKICCIVTDYAPLGMQLYTPNCFQYKADVMSRTPMLKPPVRDS